jgi:hypothetical protein
LLVLIFQNFKTSKNENKIANNYKRLKILFTFLGLIYGLMILTRNDTYWVFVSIAVIFCFNSYH